MKNKTIKRRIFSIIMALSLTFLGSGCKTGTASNESSSEAPSDSASEQAFKGGFISRLSQASSEAQNAQAGGAGHTSQAGLALFSEEKTLEVLAGTGLVSSETSPEEKKTVTLMIYMNGSDLETEGACASDDLSEMLSSGIGENVNVVIQTMGTKMWHRYGISSYTAQTYRIKGGKLELIRDNLGQLNCTSEDTLSEFISYCKTAFPAERNILLFWDHGGGPIYGFGVDEWHDPDDGLTLSEMTRAFAKNPDVHFDMIGMDCCIMASMETCYAFSPYCNYALLSEDFESGLGWNYRDWMAELEKNPGISIPVLGKRIIDEMVRENDTNPEGGSASISLFNETTAVNLYKAWKDYAYKNQEAFFKKNYSRLHKNRGRGSGFGNGYGYEYDYSPSLEDYYITDMLALIESVDNSSDEAKALTGALKAAVAYFGHTSDKNELTGMSVSLPYGDSELYRQLKEAYKDIKLDSSYVDWLSNFVSATPDYYGFEGFEQSWSGWGAYEEEYGFDPNTGQCGSCAYDYSTGSFSGNKESFLSENWIYNYEYDLWCLDDDGRLFYYDDDTGTMYYYDHENDQVYYYDQDNDEWIYIE